MSESHSIIGWASFETVQLLLLIILLNLVLKTGSLNIVPKKRSIRIFKIKEASCILEIHLTSETDKINNLTLFNGVQKTRLDLDSLQKDSYIGNTYILLKCLDEDVTYKCFVGVEDELGNVQDLESREFSLAGIICFHLYK